MPAVLVGRNDRIAWGLTNTGADVQDLYLERLEERFETREEVIKVKGGLEEKLTVRRTPRGLLLVDASRCAARLCAPSPGPHWRKTI